MSSATSSSLQVVQHCTCFWVILSTLVSPSQTTRSTEMRLLFLLLDWIPVWHVGDPLGVYCSSLAIDILCAKNSEIALTRHIYNFNCSVDTWSQRPSNLPWSSSYHQPILLIVCAFLKILSVINFGSFAISLNRIFGVPLFCFECTLLWWSIIITNPFIVLLSLYIHCSLCHLTTTNSSLGVHLYGQS